MRQLLVTFLGNVFVRWQEWRARRRERDAGDVDVIERLRGHGVR